VNVMTDRMKEAHEARAIAKDDVDYKLYKMISKHQGYNLYELSKKMKWSRGKTYGSVKRLEKCGWVKIERSEKNGRSVLKITTIKWNELLTTKEIDEYKEMKL
jgi:DNA-binding MarR family transcriptional regulator